MRTRMHTMECRRPRAWKDIALYACLLVGVSSIAGCDGKQANRVPVSGVVKIDGQPLGYGTIRFIPNGEGRPAFATIDPQGRFDFGDEGVQIGPNRLEITAAEQLGDTGYKWHAPQKYGNVATSGLEEDVQSANHALVIQLTWAGEKPLVIRSVGGDDDPKNLRGN